jgi:hypothetical protein
MTQTISTQTAPAPTATFNEWAERTGFLPGVRFEDEGGYALAMASLRDLVNADDPTTTATESLSLDFGCDDLGTTQITHDRFMQDCLMIWLVSSMHEFAEWVTLDGKRVFDPHPGRNDPQAGQLIDVFVEVLAEIADPAAAAFIGRHPRSS